MPSYRPYGFSLLVLMVFLSEHNGGLSEEGEISVQHGWTLSVAASCVLLLPGDHSYR